VLRPIRETFDPEGYPDLLVGLTSPDDAAVWRLNDRQSLVFTTDFFTPIVDDPYAYGAIAAANSLSDVYAMGGQPFLALSVAAFPANLPLEMTREILRGAAEKCREAGVVIGGGHTINDEEPKFGLAVLGMAETGRLLSKGGLRVGDHLFLTKPLGFGVTTTAHKRGLVSEEELREAITWMSTLNAVAGQVALSQGLSGVTDVTGFGLLGHLLEMTEASAVGAQLRFDALPFISCAQKYAEEYTFPGGAFDNRDFFGPRVRLDPDLSEKEQMLLFDPQTSGGLLMGVPEGSLEGFGQTCRQVGLQVWEVGRVLPGAGVQVTRA
jgi:selenide,water dikinase